jgi:Domain of unknown function (DUF4062)
MKKRYQVFVSSTFVDLLQERQSVFEVLLQLNCIPAGMESFPALDIEQFEFIKNVIDECDFYIVILGGRYGSLASDGISYTEKEYDYAVAKGIKVIALLHRNPGNITSNKTELEPEARQRLGAFRQKLEKGRLVQHWESAADLKAQVAVAITQTIERYPGIGWVRANDVSALQKQNEELAAAVTDLKATPQGAKVDERAELIVRLRYNKTTAFRFQELHCYELLATIENTGGKMAQFFKVEVEMPKIVSGWPGPSPPARLAAPNKLVDESTRAPLYPGEVRVLNNISGWPYHMTHDIFYKFHERGWPTVVIQIFQEVGMPVIHDCSFEDERFQNF